MITREPETERPAFPRCPVRRHDHELGYLYTITQDGTGERARMLQCPTGTYRFFHIEAVWVRLGQMARYHRPRWGWKPVTLDDGHVVH